MNVNKTARAIGVFTITIWLIVAIGAVGCVINIAKLASADFEQPLKEEIFRGAGVLIPPFGAVLGYVTIEDEPVVDDSAATN